MLIPQDDGYEWASWLSSQDRYTQSKYVYWFTKMDDLRENLGWFTRMDAAWEYLGWFTNMDAASEYMGRLSNMAAQWFL